MQNQSQRPQVVIVGAGFAGLEASKALAKATVDVTLVDAYNHHCFQPLLYQVATAALSPADVAWPIRAILRAQQNVRVIMARVTAIDVQANRVHTTEIDLPYDYLLLATGSTHSYFGHDDWAPFAPGLKHIADATEIRRRFLLAFERAEVVEDEAARERLLTFVIIGGGATGVEMAGAIAEVAQRTLAARFPPHRSAQIAHHSDRGRSTLAADVSRGVVRLCAALAGKHGRRGCAQSQSHRLRRGWCHTGWRPHRGRDGDLGRRRRRLAGRNMDRRRTRSRRPHQSDSDLTVPGHPDIFAAGDTASVADRDGKPVPGIAPAAKQMGRYVGQVIAARVQGKPSPSPFTYRHLGELAAIGRKSAVVKLGVFQLTGFPGWLFWSAVHIYFLIGLRNRFVVALNWLWSYLTFQRGARLIGTAPR